ncbi:MAG: YihY family inner membrane protein [Gammaproteobacteria bacterium]|nr:YihY family inner membrane protein [Gammaproteobacteria bacterium]
MQLLRYMGRICVEATKRFYNENYSYRASALAFTTLLAIVPLLLVIVFGMTVFPYFMNIILLGENYILQNFVPASAGTIEFYFHGFLTQATRLPAVSILFLFITTILLVHTIEETLNEIWRVPTRVKSKKMLALLFYWILFLLIPFIIGLSIFLTSYAFLLSWISIEDKTQLTLYFLSILPILINTMIFGLLYIIVPNARVKIINGLIGGMTAALLFEVARISFAFYVDQFPSYALIYGAFAVIPIFLVWLYIFWFIILFGAFVTYTVARPGLEL